MRLGLTLVLLSGCALVSGLDGIKVGPAVTDGGSDDAPIDVASTDTGMSDVITPGDAGPNFALDFQQTCATGQGSIPFSGSSFTVAFWMKPGIPSQIGGNELFPYVYNGGRNLSDQGWSIGILGTNFVFCTSDGVTFTCASASGQANSVGHLLHVAGVSTVGSNFMKRTLTIYALDATQGQKTHAMIATNNMAANTWTSTAAFSIGGQPGNNGCTTTIPAIIDDVRLWNRALTGGELDANYSAPATCADGAIVAGFEFDEGTGMTTTSKCGMAKGQLNINAAKWTPSPFF